MNNILIQNLQGHFMQNNENADEPQGLYKKADFSVYDKEQHIQLILTNF